MQSGAVEDGLPNVTAARTPRIQAYFDEATNSVSYLVADPATGVAAIIDPVLGFDVASGKIDNEAAGRILADTEAAGLHILWTLETHVHADHLSAGNHVREQTRAQRFARAPEFRRSKVSSGRSLELTT